MTKQTRADQQHTEEKYQSLHVRFHVEHTGLWFDCNRNLQIFQQWQSLTANAPSGRLLMRDDGVSICFVTLCVFVVAARGGFGCGCRWLRKLCRNSTSDSTAIAVVPALLPHPETRARREEVSRSILSQQRRFPDQNRYRPICEAHPDDPDSSRAAV